MTERRHLWSKLTEPIPCPASTHRLKTNAYLLGDGLFECWHRHPGQGPCGRRALVLRFPFVRCVLEITREEMFEMRDRDMDVDECLAYLSRKLYSAS